MDVSVSDDGVQTIHGRKRSNDADMVCILVKLDDEACYVLALGQLHDAVSSSYEAWLDAHDSRRPQEPESMHFSAGPKDLVAFQENRGLIRTRLA
jgi:hypothetical protein